MPRYTNYGDSMKELLIFNVKEEFYKLYKNKPSQLFFIYNRIYNMKKSDKEYGFNLFTQISLFIKKKYINDFISSKYKDKLMYSNHENEHIINNLFLNEVTILTVKNSNIRVQSNTDNPEFIKAFKDLKGKYFVCDFKNQDYYFIDNIKVK